MTEQPETPDRSSLPPSSPPPGPQPYPYAYPPAPPGASGPQGYPTGPYPGGYPPPPMPYGDYYTGVPTAMRNGLGVAALLVAILGIFPGSMLCGLGVVLGGIAIALGIAARRRVSRGEANNGGMATAGIVLGVLAIVASLAVLALGLTLFKDAGLSDYVACIRDAGGDQARTEQCSTEFQQRLEDLNTTAPGR